MAEGSISRALESRRAEGGVPKGGTSVELCPSVRPELVEGHPHSSGFSVSAGAGAPFDGLRANGIRSCCSAKERGWELPDTDPGEELPQDPVQGVAARQGPYRGGPSGPVLRQLPKELGAPAAVHAGPQ